MRIEATRHIFHRQLDKALYDESRQDLINQDLVNQQLVQDGAENGESSRALVVTAPVRQGPSATPYRQAAFLAHLIATKEHAPQTRERRRAEPCDAIAAYQATAALTNH